MNCQSCETLPISVTLSTAVGTVPLCGACAAKGGHLPFIEALVQVADLEDYWRLDSSRVKGDGYVSA